MSKRVINLIFFVCLILKVTTESCKIISVGFAISDGKKILIDLLTFTIQSRLQGNDQYECIM